MTMVLSDHRLLLLTFCLFVVIIMLLQHQAFCLPSCDEPQSITITRGQKISVVYWLGQNHPVDETLLDGVTTQASERSSRGPLDDPSSTLALDSDETTIDTTISRSVDYRSDESVPIGEQTTEGGVRMDIETDSPSSVDDDVANVTSTQLTKSDEASAGNRGERGDDDEMDFNSSVRAEESVSSYGTESPPADDETESWAILSSYGTESPPADDETESWAILFTDSPKDPDILVDPRDPATNNQSMADSSTPIWINTVDDIASSTVGAGSKDMDLVGQKSEHSASPGMVTSDEPGTSSVPSPNGDVAALTGDYSLPSQVPSLRLLQESPVHYVTVVRSPDGTLPIRSLNASPKRHTSQLRQLIRHKRSTNVTLCKWIFKSDPGVPLLLTFKTFSTPETADCKDHYIAVERESNGFQSRWCGVSGDRPGHSSFARSQISLYLSSNGDGSFPTGFSIEVQALDLKLLRKYAEVRRIVKSQ